MAYTMNLSVGADALTSTVTNTVGERETTTIPLGATDSLKLTVKQLLAAMTAAFQTVPNDMLGHLTVNVDWDTPWIGLDQNFEPVVMLASENAQVDQNLIDALNHNGIGGQLERKTATTLTPEGLLIRILDLKNNQVESFSDTAYYMHFLDYWLYQMLDVHVMSMEHAHQTNMFHAEHQGWDLQALAVSEIMADALPNVIQESDYAQLVQSAISELNAIY